MDRRDFVETCSRGAACLTASLALPATSAFGADAKPRSYERALLTNPQGDPILASRLEAQTNYVFHYPYRGTPVFLLKLGRPARPQPLQTKGQERYLWPGGVGPRQDIVAFSAICAHKLVYPTPQVSFISFRRDRAAKGMADNLIHCCADHSQYDPAEGARVLGGPADQPLCAILLEHDARTDTLTAYATLGGELFDDFFRKYEFKLGLDMGPRAKDRVRQTAAVQPLQQFCRNPVQC